MAHCAASQTIWDSAIIFDPQYSGKHPTRNASFVFISRGPPSVSQSKWKPSVVAIMVKPMAHPKIMESADMQIGAFRGKRQYGNRLSDENANMEISVFQGKQICKSTLSD